MWVCEVAPLSGQAGFRVSVLEQARRVSFAEFLDALATDAGARRSFAACLAGMPFPSFFWECVSVTRSSSTEPFECAVLPAPVLARAAPDLQSFAEHFSAAESVVSFENLGRDATLIVPCPRAEPSAYPHLAAFLRAAPPEQVDALLRAVARCARERLRSAPFWLSTSGAGVAWVHVRIDSRPKYYQYAPYRREPSGASGERL